MLEKMREHIDRLKKGEIQNLPVTEKNLETSTAPNQPKKHGSSGCWTAFGV